MSLSSAISPAGKQSSKVAVVTGAARGIGRALVELLDKRGYLVVAVVRKEEDMAGLSAAGPGRIYPVCCDVTSQSAEAVLSKFLSDNVNVVDLLVNNAGFGASGYGIEGLVLKELEALINVHCYGPIRCIRACMPFLRKSPAAAIVNVTSRFGSLEWVASGVVPSDQATYSYRIAKASMNMLTTCLSVELAQEGIKVLAIDPGKVKTRFGPKDADTEPHEAARSIVDLAEQASHKAVFLHASGEKVPW